jgi:hypothetical protein
MDDEIEMGSFCAGIEFSNEFFARQQFLTEDDLLPVIHELVMSCNSVIKECGVYHFKLQITKVK